MSGTAGLQHVVGIDRIITGAIKNTPIASVISRFSSGFFTSSAVGKAALFRADCARCSGCAAVGEEGTTTGSGSP
ncbi:hypothetical protein BN440_2305 [Erwinia amylovora MR1]|nr:hypothetical protein BN440_2305 [Erwinia amylovora MR1]